MNRFRSGFLAGVTLTVIVFLTMSAVMVRYATVDVAYREGLKVAVNGEEVAFDETPMVVNPGWIMCQLEPVVKKMGWNVSWDDSNSTLKITKPYTVTFDYLDEVQIDLALWESASNKVGDLVEEYDRSPTVGLKDRLIDAMTDLWYYSEVLMSNKPTPEFNVAHSYLVLAMQETIASIEDTSRWLGSNNPQDAKNGLAHLNNKKMYLEMYLKELKSVVK